jgi:hypothetical protein
MCTDDVSGSNKNSAISKQKKNQTNKQKKGNFTAKLPTNDKSKLLKESLILII